MVELLLRDLNAGESHEILKLLHIAAQIGINNDIRSEEKK